MKETKITTVIGLELLRLSKEGGDLMPALCSLKGVETPEQLTRSEIQELSEVAKEFTESVITPKDVNDVNIEVGMFGLSVILGNITELDLTISSLDLLEDFNPTELERVPLMLGCIYANYVKKAYNLPHSEAVIANELRVAILREVPFADTYAVYDFFLCWKEALSTTSTLSKTRLMSRYQSLRNQRQPFQAIIKRSSLVFPRRSRTITHALRVSIFCVSIYLTRLRRWCWGTIGLLRKWWNKKH